MLMNIGQLEQTLTQRSHRTLSCPDFSPAAVLLPLLQANDGEHILFTKRTERVEHHKGQISFPGGRLDEGENLQQCALRETHEEVGIEPGHIRVIGRLDDIWTPTRYVVTPFVGLVPYPYRFTLSEAEIEEIMLVPVCDLINPAIYEETKIEYQGKEAIVPYYHWGEKTIWGATGRILRQFLGLAFPGEVEPCATP